MDVEIIIGHVEKSIGGVDHTENSTTQSCNLLMIPGARSTDKSVIPYSRTYRRKGHGPVETYRLLYKIVKEILYLKTN